MSVTQETKVQPFTVDFSDEDVADLRRRLKATRFPEKETTTDVEQGTPLATIQAIVKYWGNDYDFGRVQANVNAFPNYVTEIDGLDIHFVHAPSPHENALPIIVTHGWPGSVVEQLKIIEPLRNPTAHGGSAEDAFHVVVPCMPGYGFSGRPSEPGWSTERIAKAWVVLMERLGYTRYVAAGGDWGAVVTELMALEGASALAGIHVNMAGVVPPAIDQALATGQPLPADTPPLSEEEQKTVDQLKYVYSHVFYAYIMASRPQSLTGLADSPAGLAAWLTDHDRDSLELISRVFVDGANEGLSRDDVCDNATLFWLTNTGVSSGRLYRENKAAFFAVKGVTIPTAVSVFPDELYSAPRSWAEKAFPNLIHYNRLPKGGHFAAWEQPELMVSELRTGFRSLR
ncbi:epoxide hydrolase family protein [Streptomyces sp. NBC_01294]|uniref:epoxide hydrolase family protein n=1 Tax=Streptomyces sp. NBC_01294 TaxID=2903815 RepID=UPI002DD91275|nr:epoxide hydrolase [Streptomyces sp. NBC_01294]WRZ60556.1 epoxide hydrolase [Streptomyces sp. NBC_01294]